MANPEVHEGGCLCGAVRYEVRGPTVWSAGCCCDSCTRAAGAPLIVWTGFDPANFRVIEGEIAVYESSLGVYRGFCRGCGTTLTYRKDPEEIVGAQPDIYVATRTLDDPTAYPPTEHVLYGERVGWLELGGDIPCHEGSSPDNAHRQLASMQRPGE